MKFSDTHEVSVFLICLTVFVILTAGEVDLLDALIGLVQRLGH